ncbi:MAG: potassium channel family protein [Christensenellales bacterium]|jgi:trk system potassium uptake protein TrkA
MKKRALVIGGASKVICVTGFLISSGYRVAVIDNRCDDADRLARFTSAAVLCGDATLPEMLEESGMQNADVAVAMLPTDEENFVASLLCKRLLNIKKVITVLEDEKKLGDFYRAGIDSVFCEAAFITSVINQQDVLDGLATFVPISEGRVNVVAVPICETAPIVDKKLWEIELPDEVIVGCVLRKEHSIVPRGDTRILAGDTLILIASDKQEVTAIRTLTGHDIKSSLPDSTQYKTERE